MTTYTEGRHAGEFIHSEANGFRSRETAAVASGQDLVAGQVVQFSGGSLIAADGLLASDGTPITAPAGVMFDNVDATGGAVTGAVYMARDCELNEGEMTFPTETTAGGELAGYRAALKLLGIVPRT